MHVPAGDGAKLPRVDAQGAMVIVVLFLAPALFQKLFSTGVVKGQPAILAHLAADVAVFDLP